MKAGLIAVVLLSVAGIAGSIWHRQRVRQGLAQQEAFALQEKVQALESELIDNRAREEKQLGQVQPPSVANALSRPLPAAALPPTNRVSEAAMLQDPETRALMQKQQAKAFARMADKLVSKDFIRDWNMTPEQSAQVKELVREKASAGQDLLNAMMFDGLGDATLAERGRATKQRMEWADERLRGLIGADGLAALKEQERALEDSGRVKRIGEELAAAEQPLTMEQRESLVAAMGTERQAFSFRVDYGDPSKVDFERIRDYFSEANLQIYFEDLQQLNARIVERATLFLSPSQIEQVMAAQNSQLEQARLTVRMTTELFNKRRRN